MKYVIQETAKSSCKYCNKPVHLLIEKEPQLTFQFDPLPMFYICFDCKKVFRIGIGEVERIPDENLL